ncbi:type I-E CRISPR-associated protein Cse2/CasB [Streptomyces xiaopingdaonensis]|uniref:type I-E CRISPR-associated protein Cse2/CasB n=1 Tax=Streptomyces xiaopingdaonensis TaxID=1565415 RepID=UPI0002D785B9|nr:type I-E CRISPR-associated protein Cse2/CasB [Streptomyces xiaopingdaonensis]
MTTSSPAPASARREAYELRLVGSTVHAFLEPLQRGYLNDEARAVAQLAQLRRGAGKSAEEVPELFGLTGTENLYTHGDRPGRHAHDAVHLAVTLYALHQQSQRTARMHVRGRRLGGAVRELMPPGEIDEPLRRRFVRVAGAASANVLAYRLRELVLLLRRAGEPLDYARLADQIEQALDPHRHLRTRQEWGREFHSWRRKTDEDVQSPDEGGSPATDQPTQ